jgi:hypothetical protein
MIIKYGVRYNNIDITTICFEKLCINNVITIPSGEDNRSKYFTDPLPGILKSIFIIKCDTVTVISATTEVIINTNDETIVYNNNIIPCQELQTIHNNLQIKGGKFGNKNDVQISQQNMLVKYLTGNEKVLEIGSNIGRNTLVIARILEQKNNYNFVTLECNKRHTVFLQKNKAINNFHFHIEESGLSKRRLIQNNTTNDILVSDVLIDGYTYVDIISLDGLKQKYNIVFDTLILDCGYMFYYILQDMPKLLNKINLIIMTNDYDDVTHKEFVNNVLTSKHFNIICSEDGNKPNYYEVWKKI